MHSECCAEAANWILDFGEKWRTHTRICSRTRGGGGGRSGDDPSHDGRNLQASGYGRPADPGENYCILRVPGQARASRPHSSIAP